MQSLRDTKVMLLVSSRPGAFLQGVSGLVDQRLQLDRFSAQYCKEFCEKIFNIRTLLRNCTI